MYTKFRDRAGFVSVYIKEAHPEDEWQMDSNEKEGICYRQPKSLPERVAIARDFASRFRFEMPLLVDPMDNRANGAYAGWPERIYIIDEAGTIVYKGKPGPFGFHPEEADQWLAGRFEGGVREVSGPGPSS